MITRKTVFQTENLNVNINTNIINNIEQKSNLEQMFLRQITQKKTTKKILAQSIISKKVKLESKPYNDNEKEEKKNLKSKSAATDRNFVEEISLISGHNDNLEEKKLIANNDEEVLSCNKEINYLDIEIIKKSVNNHFLFKDLSEEIM